MKFWLQEVDRYGELDVKKLLVGNKYDLPDQRVVKVATGKVHIYALYNSIMKGYR